MAGELRWHRPWREERPPGRAIHSLDSVELVVPAPPWIVSPSALMAGETDNTARGVGSCPPGRAVRGLDGVELLVVTPHIDRLPVRADGGGAVDATARGVGSCPPGRAVQSIDGVELLVPAPHVDCRARPR